MLNKKRWMFKNSRMFNKKDECLKKDGFFLKNSMSEKSRMLKKPNIGKSWDVEKITHNV